MTLAYDFTAEATRMVREDFWGDMAPEIEALVDALHRIERAADAKQEAAASRATWIWQYYGDMRTATRTAHQTILNLTYGAIRDAATSLATGEAPDCLRLVIS